MNYKKLTNHTTKSQIFLITAGLLVTTLGISSSIPAQAGSTSNGHLHSSCNSGNQECLTNALQVINEPNFHTNGNCNSNRADAANEIDDCKFNEHT